MALCTVTLNVNTMAISEAVKYQAYPNQIIDSVGIDGTPVIAQASGTAYTAELIQGGKYRVIAPKFDFHNSSFTVPRAGTANLATLIRGAITG